MSRSRNKITERDIQVLETIKYFKCGNVKLLADLHFEGKNKVLLCQKRMKTLYDLGKVNRSKRNDCLEPYIYWKNGRMPTNYKHSLKILELYVHLKKNYDIIKHEREYEIKYGNGKSLRADLMAVININGKPTPYLFEVDLSHCYNNKYTEYIEKGYYKTKFPVPPKIISISRFTVAKTTTQVPVTVIKQDKIEELVL